MADAATGDGVWLLKPPKAAVIFRRSTASSSETTRIAVRTATGGIVLSVEGHPVSDADWAAESPTAEQLYRGVVAAGVERVLAGGRASFIACGQSGSGKSSTLFFLETSQGARPGLLPRAAMHLFAELPASCEVRASFIELYNDGLYDLLARNGPVRLRESPTAAPDGGGSRVPLTLVDLAGAADPNQLRNAETITQAAARDPISRQVAISPRAEPISQPRVGGAACVGARDGAACLADEAVAAIALVALGAVPGAAMGAVPGVAMGAVPGMALGAVPSASVSASVMPSRAPSAVPSAAASEMAFAAVSSSSVCSDAPMTMSGSAAVAAPRLSPLHPPSSTASPASAAASPLDFTQFCELVRTHDMGGGTHSRTSLRERFRELGPDHEGRVDSELALRAFLLDALSRSARRLIDLLRAWDASGERRVDREGLCRAVRALGIRASSRDVDAVFGAMDREGTGVISQHELATALRSSNVTNLKITLRTGSVGYQRLQDVDVGATGIASAADPTTTASSHSAQSATAAGAADWAPGFDEYPLAPSGFDEYPLAPSGFEEYPLAPSGFEEYPLAPSDLLKLAIRPHPIATPLDTQLLGSRPKRRVGSPLGSPLDATSAAIPLATASWLAAPERMLDTAPERALDGWFTRSNESLASRAEEAALLSEAAAEEAAATAAQMFALAEQAAMEADEAIAEAIAA
ncbi:bipolar kinesin krp-130-like protein, partial [Chrysochromulina tobinii]